MSWSVTEFGLVLAEYSVENHLSSGLFVWGQASSLPFFLQVLSSENNQTTAPVHTSLQLFFTFMILIEPRIWWRTTRALGGSLSSEAASGTEGFRKQEQTNIGLLTMASEGGMASGSFNMIEIATCALAVVIAHSALFVALVLCQTACQEDAAD